MKYSKILFLTLLTFLILLTTGCSNKWDRRDPNMPDELVKKNQELLQTSLEILDKDTSNIDAQFEVGFRYQALGDYEEAVKAYKKVLEMDPVHMVALNNMAAIYEEVEEYELAAESIKKLYETNQKNIEVLSDAVRILLKADDPDTAQLVLENFLGKTDNNTTELQTIISTLYESIYSYRQQHEKK